jgi:hypothetical protein
MAAGGSPASRERAEGEQRARLAMQAARVEAIAAFPHLDHALSAMRLVAAPGLGTVGCDRGWRLYYDPTRALALASGDGVRLLVSDWIHELMHLVRDHHSRWDDMGQPPERQRLFNIAGDALINRDLAQMHLRLTPRDTTFDHLPADVNPQMTTEAIHLAPLESGEWTARAG